MKQTRLLIVDDHAVVRAGIRHILQRTSDIEVVGEARNGAEALQMVDDLCPDIILLDMEMPVINGIEVARRLHKSKSPVRILALSAYDDKLYVAELLSNGVAGYLTKDDAPKKIVEAIRKVVQGEHGWIGRPAVAKALG